MAELKEAEDPYMKATEIIKGSQEVLNDESAKTTKEGFKRNFQIPRERQYKVKNKYRT